jgi:flagellin-specific chaperone FliS
MQNNHGILQYHKDEVMSASPLRLVAMVYDFAINACEQKDLNRATKAVSVLRDVLDRDYSETVACLIGILRSCLESIRREDYDDALLTLQVLREGWGEIEKK